MSSPLQNSLFKNPLYIPLEAPHDQLGGSFFLLTANIKPMDVENTAVSNINGQRARGQGD